MKMDLEKINEIEALIGQDEIQQAIRIMLSLVSNDQRKKDVLNQSAKYEGVLKELRNGVIDKEGADKAKSKIRSELLDILYELKNESVLKNYNSPGAKKHNTGKVVKLFIVSFLALAVLFFIYKVSYSNRNCEDAKKEAQKILSFLEEKRSVVDDKYDIIRFNLLQAQMRTHLNITDCDHFQQIINDVEGAKKYLKKYDW